MKQKCDCGGTFSIAQTEPIGSMPFTKQADFQQCDTCKRIHILTIRPRA